MKKISIVLLLLLATFCLHAQDYSISFAGTGESASVGSVTVENLTKVTSITLSGTEILHLVGTSTGLNPITGDIDKALHIYPNPMTENSIVEFVATAPGMTNIELFDITGKRIAVTQNRLIIARHSYVISGLQTGIYTIRINSDTYNYTGKLVSNGSPGKEVRISYIGNNAIQVTAQKLKSATAEKTMQYTNGDLLKITGISGNYSTIIMDVPTASKTITFTFIACTDADGNNYPVVKIGDQWWMAENLKTTSYKDGSPIPLVPDYNTWKDLKTPGYCWFNNDTFYKNTYGALYNWLTVNTGKLAPTGWHVPSDAEWTVLTTFLGYEDIAGGKMKETGTTHWKATNTGATNSSGFTGLPGGYRDYNGHYNDLADRAVFWSTSDANTGDAWLRELHYSFNYVNRFDWYQVHGYSVRCIKNDINYPAEPMVTTAAATNISQTAATSGGNVTSQGSSAVTVRGVCWSTSSAPTIAGSHTTDGTGTGSFSSSITGLTANTPYFVRAYAKNSVGTTYGNEVTFTTPINLNSPTLTTTALTNISQTTATSGGNVTSQGSSAVTARGVCWSTLSAPTIAGSHTSDGTGTGSFTSSLTGLTANTPYFVRAYATNSVGTSYGNEVTFTTTANFPNCGTVIDADGNVYHTVTIGTQCWMVENLKTTKYNDGTAIPLVTDDTAWAGLTTPGYCWYNNDKLTYGNTYGALYNWYTVNTGKLCPAGWHIPSDAEWTTLTTFLGGESVAGGKMKEAGTTHWASLNTGANNSSGFTALPAGYRASDGTFSGIGDYGYWWSSTKRNTSNAWNRVLFYNFFGVERYNYPKQYGFSVRCVRD